MKRRKQPITLIEIVISLGLLTVLLSTLFFWYGRLSKQKLAMQDQHHVFSEERYVDERLLRTIQKAEGLLFTTHQDGDQISGESLVFMFDRGPCAEPALSGKVLGRLYLERSTGNLCLGIWPDPKDKCQTPSDKLKLLTDVTKLSFSFYYPPDLFSLPVNPDEIGKPKPQKGWSHQWRKEYEKSPSLIKIHVQRHLKDQNRDLTFAYDLPRASLVCYPSEISLP